MFIWDSLVQRSGHCHFWNKLDFTFLQRIIHQKGFGTDGAKLQLLKSSSEKTISRNLPLKHASICQFWAALCFHWMGYLSSEGAREKVKCFSCFWLEWLRPLLYLNHQKHTRGTWKSTAVLLKTFPSSNSRGSILKVLISNDLLAFTA